MGGIFFVDYYILVFKALHALRYRCVFLEFWRLRAKRIVADGVNCEGSLAWQHFGGSSICNCTVCSMMNYAMLLLQFNSQFH